MCYLLMSLQSVSTIIMGIWPSFSSCGRRASRFLHPQETDGICAHDDQSDSDWPWSIHRISDERSVDDSSLAVCLPTCSGDSSDQELLWNIGLDVLNNIHQLLNVLEFAKKTGCPVRLISPTLILEVEWKLCRPMMDKGTIFLWCTVKSLIQDAPNPQT